LIVISRFAGRMPIGASAGAPEERHGNGAVLERGDELRDRIAQQELAFSMRIMTAVLVMAFDIDAIRKIASVCIGALASISRLP
jgi:hypothetical protein